MKKCTIIFAMLLLFMTGCSHKQTEQTTISFYFFFTPDVGSILREICSDFEMKNPGIKVNPQEIPIQQYYDKLQTMMAGGTAPDVMLIDRTWVYPLAYRNTLLSLNGYIERDDRELNISDFYPEAVKGATYKGSVYGIPHGVNIQFIYYNKEIFDREGLSYPPVDDWTWTEFLETAEKLTKDIDGDGRIDQWGYADFPWIWEEMVWQKNGELFNEDMTEATFDRPEVVESLQFVQDLWGKYRVMPVYLYSKEHDSAQLFLTGRAAMMRSFRFWGKHIKNFAWDITPTPRWEKKSIKLGGAVLSISAQSKYPEESWKFIRFLVSPESYTRYIPTAASEIPARKSMGYLVNEGENLPPHNYIILDEMKYARSTYSHPNHTELWHDAWRILDLFWDGQEKDPSKVARMVDESLNKKLKELSERSESSLK